MPKIVSSVAGSRRRSEARQHVWLALRLAKKKNIWPKRFWGSEALLREFGQQNWSLWWSGSPCYHQARPGEARPGSGLEICIFTLWIKIKTVGARRAPPRGDTAHRARCNDNDNDNKSSSNSQGNRWMLEANAKCARWGQPWNRNPSCPRPHAAQQKLKRWLKARPKCSQANKFKNVCWISIADKL